MGEASTLAPDPPKLLTLDKADIRAIRSFLPGKLLGRTAALLALVVLVLGFATSVDVGAERFLGFPIEPPWLKQTLLFGIPVLVVGAQILAEWHSERSRRQARALAVKIDSVQEGYFRIGPYLDTAADRAKFDRADGVHEKVLDWVSRSDAMPLYLTGDSGSGKSSVLNAFVLPALREAGWAVIEARAWQDPETALHDAIVRVAGTRKWKLGEPTNLRGLLEALARRAEARFLLVLDQFEEFLILGHPERQNAFAALIAELHAKPVKGLKLLLVLRSDYQTAIDELGLPLLSQGENWIQIGRFTIAAGTRFMARSGLELLPDALDRVATSASELDDSPGMIRPITLNVVGHVLSQGRATAPSLDASRLVRHYIEQSVEQPAIRGFAPRVLRELVTEQGTKWPRSEKDLVDQTGLRRGEVRAVMNGLWSAALARPLDAAQGVWELSHDFVARAITRHLGRRRLDLAAIGRASAAPALFVVMAAIAAGAIAWNADAADRARARLAELGIDVSSTPNGVEAEAGSRFRAEDLASVTHLLGRLTALRSLGLFGTNVEDLEPLKRLTALRSLNLFGTPVAELGPLKNLSAIQFLQLSSTNVADLEPLRGMTGLQTLHLYGAKVADLEPLKGMTALAYLDISGTKVTSLEPLERLTALETLELRSTKVADLRALKGLTALHSLQLRGTLVVDLEPLKGLTALQSLELTGTKVVDLEPLKGLSLLRDLDVSHTNVADLAPLKSLNAIRSVNLNHTEVTDLGPLQGMAALESLDLSETQVADLGPLRRLTALQSLDLTNSKVADLTPLQDLPNLKAVAGAPDAAKKRFDADRAQKGLPAVSDEIQ
jgi:hypothetical protein